MNIFIETITSKEPRTRNRDFASLCSGMKGEELFSGLKELEQFRQETHNLYDKVRATIFLYAGFRYALQEKKEFAESGTIPFDAYTDILERRFEHAVIVSYKKMEQEGANKALFSLLAKAYHQLTFQYLTAQVRRSVKNSIGNQWMFRNGHIDDHSLTIHPRLLNRPEGSILYPLLMEKTPVRLDLTHSGWSDIFFLGMDYPEGANVINMSVNLGVFERDDFIEPPITSYFRVIPEPLIRITSIDLKATKDITDLHDLFNFGNDYLGLLKAAIIASGIIPPSFEGTNQELANILARIVGKNMGFELISRVNDIPKGSRLAVSTNLLASIISCIMRATSQTSKLEGELTENERRLVASRAILGEWMGGSGGGWQDSGGIWPGIKLIQGVRAKEGDPEYGISQGCLLPKHTLIQEDNIENTLYRKITDSLIVFHGGMAQNVGPILEMVTERYLLRSEEEWLARQQTNDIFHKITDALEQKDIQSLATHSFNNWNGPLKTIIPWITNKYTESLIEKAKKAFGDDFWGFQMMGGMSGGGMGIWVNPDKMEVCKKEFLHILKNTKKEMEQALPFAMEPVVYNITINKNGTYAAILSGNEALLPVSYYELHVNQLARVEPASISYLRKAEFDYFTTLCKDSHQAFVLLRNIVSNLFQVSESASRDNKIQEDRKAEKIKADNGFDPVQHEQIRQSLRKGNIGLHRNRLPIETKVEDVKENDFIEYQHLEKTSKPQHLAVMALAAGLGSRWTKGAGVIKAVNPFIEIAGKHRNFLEIHLQKNNAYATRANINIPFVVATSYLTSDAIIKDLEMNKQYAYPGKIYISEGKSIGQRYIPMARDLQYMWEEMKEELLDDEKQKVRESVRATLIHWAKEKGEGNDYMDNLAEQRLNPLGHWFEISNLIRNGTLKRMLDENPGLQTILLHNIDTLGACIDERVYHYHINSGNAFTFEVIPKHIEDKGGGLARVNSRPRLLEGLAQPNENDEFNLRFYNSMTTWIQIDALLRLFGLTHQELGDEEKIIKAIREMASRMPTYVTIKDVKYRWGHGQEDIYPVAQVEKLWSDMSALDVPTGFVVVDRKRGMQLKDPALLDEWVREGNKPYIEALCKF